VLGGAGIAVSTRTRCIEAALALALYLTSAAVQRGTYLRCGGQPAHRDVWTATEADALTAGFFRNTLETIEKAYLRPRYDGYIERQNRCGRAVHNWLSAGASDGVTELTSTLAECFG
jgi:multiple sugar transport system substrate-binding protein